MAGLVRLVPATHAVSCLSQVGVGRVDGRIKSGHDG
jgi:hypothetical protein